MSCSRKGSKVMDWLHWVGGCYYTIPQFIREARRFGVSRRINPRMLKQMGWGDRIYLAAREKGLKSPVIFGYFHLEKVYGIRLDDEAKRRLESETGKAIEVVDSGPGLSFARGCGMCVEGGLYCITTATVEELTEYGEPETPEVRGKLFIFPKPYPAFKSLSPFRGYRKFDGEAFLKDLADIDSFIGHRGDCRKRLFLKSLYYEGDCS